MSSEATRQQAEAWRQVVETMQRIDPGWCIREGRTGAESMCSAIRRLAAQSKVVPGTVNLAPNGPDAYGSVKQETPEPPCRECGAGHPNDAASPTLPSAEINELPEHVRKYIMWLETDADPAGTIRENFRLNEENKALRVLLAEYGEAPAAPLREAAHPDDLAVDRFAVALKAKLAEARAKGRGGWQDDYPGMQQSLSDALRVHVVKGDPLDVANFCMFLHERGEAILPPCEVAQELLAWIHEDELPASYPYDAMFPYSRVDGVRMFPVFAPPALQQREGASELEALRKFKTYVHQRLDEAGVEADPLSKHREAGCRIGGRLDIVLAQYGAPLRPVTDEDVKDFFRVLRNSMDSFLSKSDVRKALESFRSRLAGESAT